MSRRGDDRYSRRGEERGRRESRYDTHRHRNNNNDDHHDDYDRNYNKRSRYDTSSSSHPHSRYEDREEFNTSRRRHDERRESRRDNNNNNNNNNNDDDRFRKIASKFEDIDVDSLLKNYSASSSHNNTAGNPYTTYTNNNDYHYDYNHYNHYDPNNYNNNYDGVAPAFASPEGILLPPMTDTNNNNNNNNHDDDNEEEQPPSFNNNNNNTVSDSVADFVPVIPKSLIGLITSSNINTTADTTGGSMNININNALPLTVGDGDGGIPNDNIDGSNNNNNMLGLKYPKISPESEKRAREGRRAHVSGFSSQCNDEEIKDFFNALLPEIRRIKTEREMEELQRELYCMDHNLYYDDYSYDYLCRSPKGSASRQSSRLPPYDFEIKEEEIRKIPFNVRTDHIDFVKEFVGQYNKSKPFGFIEVNNADMITAIVALHDEYNAEQQYKKNISMLRKGKEEGEGENNNNDNNNNNNNDSNLFQLYSTATRMNYNLIIKRPKDHVLLKGVDKTKLVLSGYPSSFRQEQLKEMCSQYGDVKYFEMHDGFAYCEFEAETKMERENPSKEEDKFYTVTAARAALECRAQVHGLSLGGQIILVQPLYDYLKVVLCSQLNFNISIQEEVDPISGEFVAKYGDQYENFYRQLEQNSKNKVLRMQQQCQAGGNPSLLLLNNNNNEVNNNNNNSEDPAAVLLQITNGAGGGGGDGSNNNNNNALVLSNGGVISLVDPGKPAAKIDPLYDLLSTNNNLHDCVAQLSHFYPYLKSNISPTALRIFPTRILVLLNAFDEEELSKDEHYYRLKREMEEEVERYGRVEELIIPRRTAAPRNPSKPTRAQFFPPKDNNNHNNEPEENEEEEEEREKQYQAALEQYAKDKKEFEIKFNEYLERQNHPVHAGYGRVFVVYATVEEAAYAQTEINGKLYNNRTIITSFLFEDLWFEEEEEEKEEDTNVEAEEKDEKKDDSDNNNNNNNVETAVENATEAID